MNAQELQIGNLVLMDLGLPSFQIHKILPIDLFHINNGIKVYPIPLNNELLLKLGFKGIGHFTVMTSLNFDLGRNRSLSIGCAGTPNEMLFIREGDGGVKDDIIVIHNFDYEGMLYLHKLQNIVSTFGKELNTDNI